MNTGLSVEEVEAGPKRITLEGRTYLICRAGDSIIGYRNVCPHQYGPVVEGRIDTDRTTVVCPWHGFEFDLDTGMDDRYGESLQSVPTVVEDGVVHLDPLG